MASSFVDLFQVPSNRARSKFLARVFGIMSEEIVRLWTAAPETPYEDLGRPTVRFDGDLRGATLDFTLRSRASGKVYVAEMKCEIEYERFQYFVLDSPHKLTHHTKTAFRSFLRVAKEPRAARTTVKGRSVVVDGAILVWGAVTEGGCAAVQAHYEFADVLSVESMISDLTARRDAPYMDLLKDRQKWLGEMFNGLAGQGL
jgi:hypothetical protein